MPALLRHCCLASALLALPLAGPAAAQPTAVPSLDEIVAGYTAARGGLPAWRAVQTMEWTGSYSTFSRVFPFTLQWQRPSSYRFESVTLGGPFLWAQDKDGPWWIFSTFEILTPSRTDGPYKPMLVRQAELEPPLLDWQAKGHKLEWVGKGSIDGNPTLDLKLTLKSGGEEVWHLDASTYLEFAVDSTIFDFTQTDKPLGKRAFLSSWKKVDGVMLPMRIEEEYGARFALMVVEKATVNPKLDPALFVMPAVEPPPAEKAEEKPAG